MKCETMTWSAVKPFQRHPQLCILQLKFASQLVAQQPDFLIEALYLIGKSGYACLKRRKDFD